MPWWGARQDGKTALAAAVAHGAAKAAAALLAAKADPNAADGPHKVRRARCLRLKETSGADCELGKARTFRREGGLAEGSLSRLCLRVAHARGTLMLCLAALAALARPAWMGRGGWGEGGCICGRTLVMLSTWPPFLQSWPLVAQAVGPGHRAAPRCCEARQRPGDAGADRRQGGPDGGAARPEDRDRAAAGRCCRPGGVASRTGRDAGPVRRHRGFGRRRQPTKLGAW